MEFWRVNFTIPGVSILWGSSSPAISVKYYRRYREIPGVITIQLLSPEQKNGWCWNPVSFGIFLCIHLCVHFVTCRSCQESLWPISSPRAWNSWWNASGPCWRFKVQAFGNQKHQKPETISKIMWEKQCHKPAMTGNGKHSTYIYIYDWGMVYGIVLPTLFSNDLKSYRVLPWDMSSLGRSQADPVSEMCPCF